LPRRAVKLFFGTYYSAYFKKLLENVTALLGKEGWIGGDAFDRIISIEILDFFNVCGIK